MSARSHARPAVRLPARFRLAAIGLAFGLHLAFALGLALNFARERPVDYAEAEALPVELIPSRAPLSSPPKEKPAEPRPQTADRPAPIRPRATPSPATPVETAPILPPRPEPLPPPPAPAPVEPAPPAPAAAAPARTAPDARASFAALVNARIAGARRYPPAARARREQGAAEVAFTLSRAGRVTAARLSRSSGSPALDREALATVRRAPLPEIPAGLPAPLDLVVQVEFYVE